METICADGLKLVTKASNVFPSWNKQHVLSVEVSHHTLPQLKQTSSTQCWGFSHTLLQLKQTACTQCWGLSPYIFLAETNSMHSVLRSLTTHFPSWNKQHVLYADISHYAHFHCWNKQLVFSVDASHHTLPQLNKQHGLSVEVSHHALPQLELHFGVSGLASKAQAHTWVQILWISLGHWMQEGEHFVHWPLSQLKHYFSLPGAASKAQAYTWVQILCVTLGNKIQDGQQMFC